MKAFYDTDDVRHNDDPQLSVVEVVTRDETGRTQVSLHVGGQAVGEIVEVSERASHLIAFNTDNLPLFGQDYDELSFTLQYEPIID